VECINIMYANRVGLPVAAMLTFMFWSNKMRGGGTRSTSHTRTLEVVARESRAEYVSEVTICTRGCVSSIGSNTVMIKTSFHSSPPSTVTDTHRHDVFRSVKRSGEPAYHDA
jgi:hypothetical protein